MATWYQLYFDDHGMPQLYLVKNHAGRYHWPREWGRLDLSPIAKSEFSRLSTFWLFTLPYHFLIDNVIRSILLLHCQHCHHVLQASLVLAPPKMWFSGDAEAIPPLPTRERRRLILDILVFDHLKPLTLDQCFEYFTVECLDMAWHGLTWLDKERTATTATLKLWTRPWCLLHLAAHFVKLRCCWAKRVQFLPDFLMFSCQQVQVVQTPVCTAACGGCGSWWGVEPTSARNWSSWQTSDLAKTSPSLQDSTSAYCFICP